ncbi:long-chain-fatty-acid--CoA ligase [marine gamma proteobacterium HTCC2143]|jgi:long-chain acyl-CoA synthetase|uniref:Long-chain-fatty-acid--CoA ligase n=1 Tax=marine gamma proteobacterium HTCC2143 TaxID=247633 RepID=A0YGU7_9GAMM|nr:long-chain-fatty-acid--CoA ligase [marine gamma proteobacterium HTCC2143]
MYTEMQTVWDQLTGQGGPFEVVEAEVGGNLLKTYATAPPSLRELWLSSLAFADRDYLVFQDERKTYAEAHADVAAIANWLLQQGIKPGDRIAIAMRNYPEWLLIYWACMTQGIAIVGMNAWWVEEEMAYGLEDSTPKILFCDQERLDRFNNIRDNFTDIHVVTVRCASANDTDIAYETVTATPGVLPDQTVAPDDDACIFYTSGTTGRPKGAQLTHRGCVSNIMNIAFFGNLGTLTTALVDKVAPPNPEDAVPISGLITTPLFHVTANNCLAQAATASGGKLALMYRWDAEDALKIIEAEKITNLTGVPVMSRELISHPDFEKYDTSSLLSVGGGGAQLQPDLVAKIDKAVATARPSTGYGMTETCGIISSISGDFFVDKPDSCGRAVPTLDAKCFDAEGNEVAQGEVGEMWVKGAPVIKGYLNRPDATAESITDGWLHTGDVARIDKEGFIFVVDRVKDMVLRGGENIYCAEVESVVFHIDGVAECTVFGVEDDRLGEEVGLAVVLAPGSNLDAEAIRTQCAARMAKFKIPRYIWLMTESLPRNASGKFLKRELRESLKISNAA